MDANGSSGPPPLPVKPPPLPERLQAEVKRRFRKPQDLWIFAGAAVVSLAGMLFLIVLAFNARFGSSRGSGEIDRIVLDQNFGLGFGGYMTSSYDPLILFKDGTVTKEEKAVEPGFDRKVHRKEKPKAWGKWKTSGSNVVIRWDHGKNETIKKAQFAELPKRKLSRRYNATGGGGNLAFGGTSSVYWSRSYEFTKNGRFETGGSAGASSSGDGWGGGSGGVTVASKRKATGGKYRVDGYLLHLEYDDGKTDTRLFYFFSKTGDVCGIGGTTFLGKK